MQIYVINLDRHPQRLEHMRNQLKGISFERIAAIDGRGLEGPETRMTHLPKTYENLSRYLRANVLSHRTAWKKLLDSRAPFACVLDDDLFVSPEFAGFINDESWIPSDAGLVKIETNKQKILYSRATIAARNRSLNLLLSTHLGAAGYIVSRRGAETLLQGTDLPNRPLDYLMFDPRTAGNWSPIYQLTPALCIQAKNVKNGMLFPELGSAVQNQKKQRKPILIRAASEISRPFVQFGRWTWSWISGEHFHAQRGVIKFT